MAPDPTSATTDGNDPVSDPDAEPVPDPEPDPFYDADPIYLDRRRQLLAPYVKRIEDRSLFDGRLPALLKRLEEAAHGAFHQSRLCGKVRVSNVVHELDMTLTEYLAHGRMAYDEIHPGTPAEDDESIDDDCVRLGGLRLKQDFRNVAARLRKRALKEGELPDDLGPDDQGTLPTPVAHPSRNTAKTALEPEVVVVDGIPYTRAERREPLTWILRWVEVTADQADPTMPADEDPTVYGIGLTRLQLDLVEALATTWSSKPVAADEDRVKEFGRTCRQVVEEAVGLDKSDPAWRKEQDRMMSLLDRGIHGLRKMLYVLGGLGPWGALFSVEGVDHAVALYRQRYNPQANRIGTELGRERTILDRAAVQIVRTPHGAQVVAAAFDAYLLGPTADVRPARRALEELAPGVEPREVLHTIERSVAQHMRRFDPDCVLRDQCTVYPAKSGGRA